MAGIKDVFGHWQSYPAAFAAMAAPWFQPFQKLGWINSDWSPVIDPMATVLAGLYLLYMAGSGFFDADAAHFRRSFLWSAAVTAILAAFCYVMSHYLIDLADPDWLFLANAPWAIAYTVMYMAFLRTFLSALMFAKW
ncbi:hypothetical protein [Mesorhizobium sp. B2-3-4]|uniref:hypothetical protein n=1 Tax=Mesorhizobium sp. B2-3-4 TaxID=2589959 RepID=UPI001128B2F6|nr:hypothetical protein [Mesorhizobium sp. B2-3-4]TPM32895.1 hypothetical protein FJ967_23580 [Mesorhizobium sp. B2-3-4]